MHTTKLSNHRVETIQSSLSQKMTTDLNDATASLSLTSPPGSDDLSPLEQDVLEEYERLADNMKKACIMQSIISLPALI